jgi:hypothetical protein
LRGPDRDIHKEIAIDGRLAQVNMNLRLNRDGLEKLVGQKNFLAP